MKKLLLLISILTLTACGNTEENEDVDSISFSGETYEYVKTENDYDIFTNNGHIVEVQYGTVTIITTEIDDDIYIIQGDAENYEISKNGNTILVCSGTPTSCTGYESVDFKDDIIGIINEYN